MLNNVNESHVNRYRIVLAANICRPEERQEKKRKKEKDLEVRVYLLLTGVINSGGALVRDLSTQIWITRQKNLTRSNLCVWYLHESKRECETSAATMGIHMFFHPFFSLPGVDLHLCGEKYCVCQKKGNRKDWHESQQRKDDYFFDRFQIWSAFTGREAKRVLFWTKYNWFVFELMVVCVAMIRLEVRVELSLRSQL